MDILPVAQQRLWPELRNAKNPGFTLYGGTAIALRLGHRDSVDFDFFLEQPLDREAIRAAFPFIDQSTTLQDHNNAWVVLVPCGDSARDNVKISFFGTIGFGRVGEPEFIEDGVLRVASFEDLMATKVKVVLQRAEAKDYRDVAAMINAGVSLAQGLASAPAVVHGDFHQGSVSMRRNAWWTRQDERAAAAQSRKRAATCGSGTMQCSLRPNHR